ncbi:Lrp/AsnC family transcriptional regulator [Sinosporangium siamense]|uniref:AsnC family transcriptional regulator n=1 Tax=Sinosporangium siamense TaxID=1367973 RepID=A0A919V9B7_9ACTN|nr:AsnC family transcriptional regulator [Sinosporangium siamense]GII97035.1 AsnC family transcriptional regulator [Sinosporangium siamense]
MADQVVFDEVDLALVDAVRTAPRASWRTLADVLGVDPATVSRRWARMNNAGVAWVTAHPSGGMTPACALVEVDCSPGRSADVARALADDVEAATVKITSGGRDVVMIAQAPDLPSLSHYLLKVVGRVPGILRLRSHVVTRSALEASRWREGALNSAQKLRLSSGHGPDMRPLDSWDEIDRNLVRVLHADGRMSFERLAQNVGMSPISVRRRVQRLRESGLVTLRCDVSQQLSGRSVAAVYFGSLDMQDLGTAEERIRSLPGVRAATFVAGPFNVIVDASLRSIAEVHDLEWRMGQALPEMRVQDRSVVLSMVKLLGRVLDSEGRSVRAVPLLRDDDVQA